MTKPIAKTGIPRMGRYTPRSRYELNGGQFMKDHGVKYTYEEDAIPYTIPTKRRNYYPDFRLRGTDKYFEFKGRFVPADRAKMLYVKEQNPNLDLTIVFMRPNNTISKISKTTYADWCAKNGIKWITYPEWQELIVRHSKGTTT